MKRQREAGSMSCGTAPAASWTMTCGTENEVSMKRKRWEASLADDGSEDWERERQERQARLQMQLLMNDHESFWSLMVSTEERIRIKQRTASTTIAAAVRRRLGRYVYALKKIAEVRAEGAKRTAEVTDEASKLLHEPLTAAESTAAGRAAEVLASSLGLCVLSSEEQLQLPCIAPFIERLESMRYVCRACVPGRTNEEHSRAFCELKEQEGGASFFAWHGSPFKNWPAIIATGLKVMSDTSEMLHGKLHGAGIYFAQMVDQSLEYSMGDNPLRAPVTGMTGIQMHRFFQKLLMHRIMRSKARFICVFADCMRQKNVLGR